MYKVIFTSWQPGLQKISLAQLLYEKADFRGPTAKECVDRLLEGEGFTVELSTVQDANDLASSATELGAVCHVEPD